MSESDLAEKRRRQAEADLHEARRSFAAQYARVAERLANDLWLLERVNTLIHRAKKVEAAEMWAEQVGVEHWLIK